MKNVHERALAWLEKQLTAKDMALFHALHKPNASEKEIENLEDAIEIIEYIKTQLDPQGDDSSDSV